MLYAVYLLFYAILVDKRFQQLYLYEATFCALWKS